MKHLALLLPALLCGCVTGARHAPTAPTGPSAVAPPTAEPTLPATATPAVPRPAPADPDTAAAVPPGDVLILEATGFRGARGQAAFALYDDAGAYARSGTPLRSQFVAIVDGRSTWRVEGLPPGRYAVKAYHDGNSNRRLDRGAFNIPKEPYGFSNNARGRRGPPAWTAASFDVTSGETRMGFAVR